MKLEELKGVGKKRAEALNKLDIFCVEDLIAYLPIRYRDLTTIALLNAVGVNSSALFKVRTVSKPIVKFPRKNFSITTCEIEDISGRATAVWFNQPYLAQNIKSEETIYLYGAIEIKQGRRKLMNPSIEHEEDLSIAPVYRLPASSGINQKSMRALMRQAIEYCAENETEVFDEAFRQKHKLISREKAIRNIHFPQNEFILSQARRRLCFEELIKVQLFIRTRKKQNETEAGKIFTVDQRVLEDFYAKLPYKLTNAQSKCVNEIIKDVQSGKAMNRLVQGDVGCGKTIVAFIAMLLAVKNGGQAALMAPTEILARQHYLQLVEFFGKEKVAFLSGSLTVAKRKEELERVKNGQAKYIVGTNALIQNSVEYNNLLLVITDEQHRFGVAQ